ncbi:MAG: rhodanese-like domain-containing protein [Acidobacteriales bacterium]|nr:rhodanese-like domain-containing protein [Terriglobales bacterium]
MKRILPLVWMGIALGAFAVLWAQTATPAAAKPDPRRISAVELEKMLAASANIFLLDVREPKELEEEGAIKGAINIPLGTLADRLAQVPKGMPVVSICRRAHRAARAADLLEKNGYTGIRTFAMNDWREKGYPLEHPKAPPSEKKK